jgi:hypothetical protein
MNEVAKALKLLQSRREIMKRNYEKNKDARLEYSRMQYAKKKEARSKSQNIEV